MPEVEPFVPVPPLPKLRIRRKSDGTLFDKGEQLCESCANADGCPLREGVTRLIRLCSEFDSSADILGPVPSLVELEQL